MKRRVKACMAILLLTSIIMDSTGCMVKDVISTTVSMVSENSKTTETMENTDSTLVDSYETFSEDIFADWLIAQLKDKAANPEIEYTNLSISDDELLKQIQNVFSECIEYQYMCSRYKISCTTYGKRVTCKFSIEYRKVEKDIEDIPFINSEDDLYQYIVGENSDGTEKIVFSYKKLKKKQISRVVETTFWNDAANLVITPTAWSMTVYGNKNTTARIMSLSYNYKSINDKKLKKAQKKVKTTVKQMVKKLHNQLGDSLGNNQKTYKAINRMLCQKISYDHNLARDISEGKQTQRMNYRSTYGALVKKKTVCSGYAASFKTICDALKVK